MNTTQRVKGKMTKARGRDADRKKRAVVKASKVNIDAVLKKMVKAVVSAADYDAGKQLDPKTAEEPDDAEGSLWELVLVAREHLAVLLPSDKREGG